MKIVSLIIDDILVFLSLLHFENNKIDGSVNFIYILRHLATNFGQLQLVCLFGILEYLLSAEVVCSFVSVSLSISSFIIDRLKTCSSDFLLQAVALAHKWWSFVLKKVRNELFEEYIVQQAQTIFKAVWLHAGSAIGVVQKSVSTFFEYVFRTALTLSKKDPKFTLLYKNIVNIAIMYHPMDTVDHFKSQKNCLHCLIPAAKCLGFLEVFKCNPFLVCNLLIATGYNHTSNLACDLINMIFEYSNFIKENSPAFYDHNVVKPIVQFMLTGNLDCPVSKEPNSCYILLVNKSVQNTNWDNFVNGCLTSKFTLLPSSPEMLESISPLPACQTYAGLCKSDLLIDQLLEYIPSVFLNSKSNQSAVMVERNLLFVWLRLYNLRDYFDLSSSLQQTVPTVLAKSAMHHDESIRVLALSGISKFLCKLIRTKCKEGNDKKKSVEFMLSDVPNLQIFMDTFLNCCTTFNNCSNPACRKQFQQIFSSLTESIRMMCKSVCINDTELSLLLDKCNVNNNNNDANNKVVFYLQDTEIDSQVFYHLPSKLVSEDIMHQSCDDTAVVLCLAKLIRFISTLCRSTLTHRGINDRTSNKKVSACIVETYFWPGMSYQRAKFQLDVIETALGLLNLSSTGPWNKKFSKWRADFGKDSLNNLQTLIDNISMKYNWDFKSVNSLRILFNGLLYLSSDLHPQIMSVIYDHWIERKDLLMEVLYPTAIDLACAWCDTPWCSVYPAGANILSFCCINGLWDVSYFGSDMRTWILNKLKRFLELDEKRSKHLGDSDDLFPFSNKLLWIVQFQSGLGFLQAVDQILSNCLVKLSKNIKNCVPNQLVEPALYELISCAELPILCLQLCNLCLYSMGCQTCQFNEDNIFITDFSKGASSFQELGKAILTTITLARRSQLSVGEGVDRLPESHLIKTLSTSTSCPISSDNDSDLHLFNSIELLPEYQHILSWAWNTLKFCSSILASWSALQFKLNHKEMSLNRRILITKIGYHLLHQLLQCRHKGSIEAIYFNLLLYLQTTEAYQSTSSVMVECEEKGMPISQVDFSTNIEYSLIPNNRLLTADHVLCICWQVINNSAYSVTRRGAGVKPAIRACLLVKPCNGIENPPCSLVRCLESLFKITQLSDKEEDDTNKNIQCVSNTNTLHDSPRVFALHLLHGLFTDSRLRVHEHPVPVRSDHSQVSNWTIEALRLAVVPGFNSKKWNVWNAALQLHSALVYRLTGATSDSQFPVISDVYLQYPQILDIILSCLNKTYQDLSSGQSLIPLLTLIVRFSASADQSFLGLKEIDNILEKLEHLLLNHSSMYIRKLVSKAYFVFLNPPIDTYYQDESVSCCHKKQSTLCKISCVGPLKLMYYSCVLHNIETTHSYNSISNAIHGQLCLLQSWYQHETCATVQKWRASFFNMKSAFNYLTKWTSISCWYLAYELCILINAVLVHTSVNANYVVLFQSEVWTRLSTLPKSVFILTNEPFHMEFLVEFYHICSRLQSNSNLVGSLIINNKTDPILLLRFLNLIKPHHNYLSEEFHLQLIEYWMNWRPLPPVEEVNCKTQEISNCSIDPKLAGDNSLLEYLHPTVFWCLLEFFVVSCSSTTECCSQKKIQTEVNLEIMLSRLWNLCSCNEMITGIRFCVNRSRVLYLITHLMCLSSDYFCFHVDKWLDLVTDCLQFHKSTTSRIFASKSIHLWIIKLKGEEEENTLKTGINSLPYRIYLIKQSLNLSQRKRLLNCILQSLFDESHEVRSLMSAIVNLCLERYPDNCEYKNNLNNMNNFSDSHLIGVHKLLKEILPLLLNDEDTDEQYSMHSRSESTNWLCDYWLTVMKSMNCLLIGEYESSQRNILYEREAYNLFCEPRLLIDLLFTHLCSQKNLSKENLLRITLAVIEQADYHLQSLCALKGLQTEKVLDVDSWCGPAVPVGVFTRQYSVQLVNSLK
ncbi:unnamed protein product [Trichobilharzia szidati]|nr:unnamed protein product [Trichobilharzia szidati]